MTAQVNSCPGHGGTGYFVDSDGEEHEVVVDKLIGPAEYESLVDVTLHNGAVRRLSTREVSKQRHQKWACNFTVPPGVSPLMVANSWLIDHPRWRFAGLQIADERARSYTLQVKR